MSVSMTQQQELTPTKRNPLSTGPPTPHLTSLGNRGGNGLYLCPPPGSHNKRVNLPAWIDGPTNTTKITQETCDFCNRTSGSVVCRSCGHTFHGRVRNQCSSHPEVIHLMDFDVCPNCKQNQLKEFVQSQSRPCN